MATFCFGVPLEGVKIQHGAGVHETSDGCEETHVFLVFQVVQHALHLKSWFNHHNFTHF
jgi:hypothetical protein